MTEVVVEEVVDAKEVVSVEIVGVEVEVVVVVVAVMTEVAEEEWIGIGEVVVDMGRSQEMVEDMETKVVDLVELDLVEAVVVDLTKVVEIMVVVVVTTILVVECRVTVHKEVDTISKAGVISSSKDSRDNKAGASNRTGVTRVNSKVGDKDMDSGVMVSSKHQIPISRHRITTGELMALVHGQLTGAKIMVNSTNSGMVSRWDNSTVNSLVQAAARVLATLVHKTV